MNRRDQKPGDTASQYGAEFKKLYDKVYQDRNPETRREDLLRRFLEGLTDENARFQIEFVKEPADIEEAIRHVIYFTGAKKSNLVDDSDKRQKKMARQVLKRKEPKKATIKPQTETKGRDSPRDRDNAAEGDTLTRDR